MPGIQDARDALKYGDEIGSGAYRSVLRRPGDYWCYKIPSLVHYEHNPALNKYIGDESLENWMKESNLSSEVEYFNYKRIVKDWGGARVNAVLFEKTVRLPEMKILRGMINGRYCRVIAAAYFDLKEVYDQKDLTTTARFAERYSLDDMHTNNIRMSKDGEIVAVDLGEDTWNWSNREEGDPCTVDLQDYKRYLRYGK